MTTPAGTSVDYAGQLAHIKECMEEFARLHPGVMRGFTRLHESAAKSGVLDMKTKELIAMAIGVAARCDGCIALHTHDALEAGATEDEIVEALDIAVLMGGGPSLVYAIHSIEAMQQFKGPVEEAKAAG